MLKKIIFIGVALWAGKTHSIGDPANQDLIEFIQALITNQISHASQPHTGAPDQNTAITFSEAELSELSHAVLAGLNPATVQQLSAMAAVNSAVISALKSYAVSGFGFSVHPSLACLYGTQYVNFDLVFKNSAGEAQTRAFKTEFSTLGWKNEATLQADFIFVLGKSFNAYSASKPMALGRGFEIGLRIPYLLTKDFSLSREFEFPYHDVHGNPRPRDHLVTAEGTYPLWNIGLTYIPFATMPGGLLMLHGGFGLTGLTAPAEVSLSLHPIDPVLEDWFKIGSSYSALTLLNLSLVLKGGLLSPT